MVAPVTVTEERAGRTSTETLALAAALVTVVLWASAFVGIRAAGERSLARRARARAAARRQRRARRAGGRARRANAPRRARDVPRMLVCGVLWFGVYNFVLNEAERQVDAGTAAMLVNVGPI